MNKNNRLQIEMKVKKKIYNEMIFNRNNNYV